MTFIPLLTLALSRAEPTTITYTNPGARMEVIFPELSKLTGLTLRPSKEMAGRVLILRLDQAPIKKVLDRIAHASYGQWGADQGAYVLYRDQGRYDADVEKARQKHITEVAKTLAAFCSAPVKPPETGTTPDGGHFTSGPSVEGQATIKAIGSAFDPAVIASLPVNRVLTYSTNPTRLQLPLPPGATAVFHSLIAGLQAKPDAPRDDFGGSGPFGSNMHGKFGKADVGVYEDETGELNFKIQVFSAAGNQMYTDEVDARSDPDTSVDGAGGTKDDLPDAPLPLSAAVKEYLRVSGQDRFGGRAPNISPELLKRLKSPLEFDPDSLLGEVMVAYSQKVNRQLVASPPDCMAPKPFFDLDLTPTVQGVEQFLQNDATRDDGAKDGWIEVSDASAYPDLGTSDHRDRRLMAQLIVDTPDSEGLGLKELVRAYREGVGDLDGIPQALLYSHVQAEIKCEEGLLRVLSGLSNDELDQLLSGMPLTLGSLSPQCQDAFTAAVLDPMFAPDLDDGRMSRAKFTMHITDSGFESGTMSDDALEPNDNRPYVPPRKDQLWREFTEVAQTYAPPYATLRLSRSEEPSITVILPSGVADPNDGGGFQRFPDPSSVFEDVDGEAPKVPKPLALGVFSAALFGNHTVTRYRTGTNQSYMLRITYAPYVSCDLGGMTTTFDSAPLKYGELSDQAKHTMELYAAWLVRKNKNRPKFPTWPGSGDDKKAGGPK